MLRLRSQRGNKKPLDSIGVDRSGFEPRKLQLSRDGGDSQSEGRGKSHIVWTSNMQVGASHSQGSSVTGVGTTLSPTSNLALCST